MLESMHATLSNLAAQTGTPLVDVRAKFEEATADGILGDELLLDHVHPNIRGHQLIAEALVSEMVRLGFVTLPSDWQQRRRALFQDHLATLDTPYYARGKERLEGLRKWTQGRAMQLQRAPLEKQDADANEN
jgi:hypothetical protein